MRSTSSHNRLHLRAQPPKSPPLFDVGVAAVEIVDGRDPGAHRSTLTNLGLTQQQLGRLDEAEQTQTRALTIKENTDGPNHPEVALTLNT